MTKGNFSPGKVIHLNNRAEAGKGEKVIIVSMMCVPITRGLVKHVPVGSPQTVNSVWLQKMLSSSCLKLLHKHDEKIDQVISGSFSPNRIP